MPDSLNIASQQHTADMAETVGNHSFHHHHVYKPAHPGGLTDSLPAAATGLKPLATYPLVDDRQGEMPEEYHQTPADSSIMITLLVVSFLLIAYCYKKGSNFFQKIRHGLYSVKRTENHLDEHTSNETLLLTALIAVAVIMEGIVVYSAALQWLPQAQSMSMTLPPPPMAAAGTVDVDAAPHLAVGCRGRRFLPVPAYLRVVHRLRFRKPRRHPPMAARLQLNTDFPRASTHSAGSRYALCTRA